MGALPLCLKWEVSMDNKTEQEENQDIRIRNLVMKYLLEVEGD